MAIVIKFEKTFIYLQKNIWYIEFVLSKTLRIDAELITLITAFKSPKTYYAGSTKCIFILYKIIQ